MASGYIPSLRTTWQAAKVAGATLAAAKTLQTIRRKYQSPLYDRQPEMRRSHRMNFKSYQGRRSTRRYKRPYRPRTRYVQSVPKLEVKFDDTLQGATAISTTGTVHQNTLLIIAEGVKDNERIGRKITVTKVMFKGQINMPTQTNPDLTQDRYRIVIFQDRQANKAAATWLNIYESATIDSFRLLANAHRFRILYDKTRNINQSISGNGTASDSAGVTHNIEFYINCNIVIHYDDTATTGALTTITSNNIGMMAISNEGRPIIAGQFRIRFHE